MIILETPAQLRAWRAQQQTVALVPTMGNLHAGHLALVELATRHAPQVLVSIFVNPLQFGVNEDFADYPRTLAEDVALLEHTAADVVFAPNVEALFPQPQSYHIEPPAIASELCGFYRPGHFRGVATIVMKLFQLAQPQIAVFGKKDYQQLSILRAMAIDFAVPVTILAGETIRAADGLALSSRNRYLNPEQRLQAPLLYLVLSQMQAQIANGVRNYPQLEQHAATELTAHGWRVDYVSVRDRNLNAATEETRQLVILAAAYLHKTRLIDNIEIDL